MWLAEPPPFLVNQLVSLKACLVIHFAWTTSRRQPGGNLNESLAVSGLSHPHGIWYFRKVTIMPYGRRKEIKKTLRTRDKSEAKRKVLDLLSCVRSSGKNRPDTLLPSPSFWNRPTFRLQTPSWFRTSRSVDRNQPLDSTSASQDLYISAGQISQVTKKY